MADEKEELLNQEIEDYEEDLRKVAGKLQELAGVDCSFGACVFDPEMKDVEAKLAELVAPAGASLQQWPLDLAEGVQAAERDCEAQHGLTPGSCAWSA